MYWLPHCACESHNIANRLANHFPNVYLTLYICICIYIYVCVSVCVLLLISSFSLFLQVLLFLYYCIAHNEAKLSISDGGNGVSMAGYDDGDSALIPNASFVDYPEVKVLSLSSKSNIYIYDVLAWEHFPRNWLFQRESTSQQARNTGCDVLFMLGLHRTPEGLETDLRPKMAKLAVTRELVGKVICSSYVTHQKVISYSWILAITRTYSPLKSTSSTIAFNRQKRSWNFSISLASDRTRSWILPWSQVLTGWS